MPNAEVGRIQAPQRTPAALPRFEPSFNVREMLFPCDLAPESEHAFEHARVLAERFQARLTLYHAVEFPDHVYAHWAFNRGNQIWRQLEQSSRAQLERKGQLLSVSHSVTVERTHSAQRALLEQIKTGQPDLTVMATHGRGGLSHMLLGSVTEYVFQHSFRPVLCVRQAEHGAALPYRRILVPTDLSLGSRLVFPIAARFALQFGAEIVALHVTAPDSAAPAQEVPSEAWLWKFFERDFPGAQITAQVERGTVWQSIVETARAEKVDLIVMSTRGHNSLSDRVMGSNTERVVRHAPCPVLVA